MRSVRNFFGRSAGVSAVVATAVAMTIALSSGAEVGGKHKERVLDDTGELRRFVNVYINGDDVRFIDGLNSPLKDGDEVSIVPAVAGGA